MRSWNGVCFASLFALAIVGGTSAQAEIIYTFQEGDLTDTADDGSGDLLAGDAYDSYYYAPAPLVPNMIGGDSLGIPFDNAAAQARLTFQHFLRVADNNSPIPRDRVSFAYKNYHNTDIAQGLPVQQAVHDLQEFQGRIEKTFFQGMMSAEFILPFAHTTDSTKTNAFGDPPSLNTELGNIGFGVKGVLLGNERNYLTAGLLVEAPTADDRGIPLVSQINNDAWFFTPYLATLLQPNDNWFIQGFASVRMATELNDDPFLNRSFSGPDFLLLDLGTGYRMYTSNEGWIRSITPTVELHYTHSMERFDEVNPISAYYFAIGKVDYLTLTAGSTVQIGENSTFAFGFALPLRDNYGQILGAYQGPTDRQFDWAFLAQINVYRR